MLQPSRPAGTFKLKVYYVCTYLPSLNGPLSLCLSFSLFHSLILRFFSKERKKKYRALFIVPLSSGLQTYTQNEGLSYILFFFFRFLKYFVFDVFGTTTLSLFPVCVRRFVCFHPNPPPPHRKER